MSAFESRNYLGRCCQKLWESYEGCFLTVVRAQALKVVVRHDGIGGLSWLFFSQLGSSFTD